MRFSLQIWGSVCWIAGFIVACFVEPSAGSSLGMALTFAISGAIFGMPGGLFVAAITEADRDSVLAVAIVVTLNACVFLACGNAMGAALMLSVGGGVIVSAANELAA